mgnify:FL=1
MKLSFIGTGLMGRPMATRLLQAGYEVTVYNRTEEKARPLQALGAKLASSSREAVEASTVVILMVADYPACQAVLFPAPDPPDLQGRTVIQMGTISPRQSLQLMASVRERGGDYLEAPVLGSIAEAEKGELVVLVGSSETQFDRFQPVFQCFSPRPIYVGVVGQAAAFKLALNQLIASLTAGFAFSLNLIRKRNIPLDLFMDVLRRSSLYAYHFDKKLSRLWNEDYSSPTFPLRLLYKDVGLMIEEGKELGLETDSLEGIFRLLEKGLNLSWGEEDYTAIGSIILGKK